MSNQNSSKVVGLTGGIGSGKSTVAKMLELRGVPVYYADTRAKYLMVNDRVLKNEITILLGCNSYRDGELNRKWIAGLVFKNKILLDRLNKLVHPVVASDFEEWKNSQKGKFVVKEAAVLFENGSYKLCDFILLITAPEAVRIARVMKRDGVNKVQVLERIQHQWLDTQKILLSDYVIENTDLEKTSQELTVFMSVMNDKLLKS